MGRQIIVNGEVVPLAQDTITAGELKRQIHVGQDMWVLVSRSESGIIHLSDGEYVPLDAQTISVVPGYDYGR